MSVFSMQLLAQATVAQSKTEARIDRAPLPNTKPLLWTDDIASRMVSDVDQFLLRKLEDSVAKRERYWKRDFSSTEAYDESIMPNRKRLAHILGLRDRRVKFDDPELLSTVHKNTVVAETNSYRVLAVRWPVIREVYAEGLLLVPKNRDPSGFVVAIPDADQTPEQLVGLEMGIDQKSQYPRLLAQNGYKVLILTLIDRQRKHRNGRANLTNREYLYRSAFELGRHLVGYEVQKVLSAVDWFYKESKPNHLKIGVFGYGEGGMIGLYAAALDKRIDSCVVSGFFGSRQNSWMEPIDRNVFGLLKEFGNAELATMVAPRQLIVEASRGPELKLTGEGGAPAVLKSPTPKDSEKELDRAKHLLAKWDTKKFFRFVDTKEGAFAQQKTMRMFHRTFHRTHRTSLNIDRFQNRKNEFDTKNRQQRQIAQIDRHNQWVLRESPYIRREFMKQLNTKSLQSYKKSVEIYRHIFREQVIGHFDEKLLPFNVRSRKSYDEEKWTGYEVVLDVFPDVFAYGILLLPKDLKLGEKRPVVVCQHGLEGRPQNVVTGNHRAYHDFAAKLAERGFITFAPQNLYIFTDRFRTLQRKANPLGKTLFSVIVPQHRQIVNWLKTLPYVDSKRIAFYGLSYGGKSAMRIPALVTDYCLSICSGDFNDWVWKNASTRSRYSYVWTGEYEMFEFDLGSTFNYSEMAALIAPRPFMVERGHSDGVAPDEAVAYEFAKVRHLYASRLKIPNRCEIEWFDGPHTINGKGTFDFLHRHLHWPKPNHVGEK